MFHKKVILGPQPASSPNPADMDAIDFNNSAAPMVGPIMTTQRQPDMTTNDAERAATVLATTFVVPN